MGDVVLGREEIRALVAGELGVDPATIGMDDNLVSLGLHSMRMIRIAAGLRRKGVRVNFSELALQPSVQAWTDLLAERSGARNAARPRPAPAAPTQRERPSDSEPFGLATMQHGYWIGRKDEQALGGVASHLYAEFDGRGVDPERLERAVAALIRRHGMLRSQFLDDGTQRVLDAPGVPVWSVTDLRDAGPAEVEEGLERIRQEKTHQRMRADLGQLVDISLTLLPGGRTRLHADVDMMAADALSYRILLADLAEFYTSGASDLGDLSYNFRDYLTDYASVNASAHEREQDWWREVLPDMPGAPALPLVPESEQADALRSVRYEHWLDPECKRRLIERSRKNGVTPATVLASIFAEIVGQWSSEQKFLLNLPLFNREPLHPDVEKLVGDFSSSVLLDVDVTGSSSLLERARAFQHTLHTRASHAAYPGLDVLRDLGRLRGEPVLASVVYTSGLDLGELFRDSVIGAFGEPVWIISQGPQVVLDAQVVELRGGLLLNWDVREHAFPAGMMDTMFRRHRETIDELLGDDENWDRVLYEGLPPEQRDVRAKANSVERAVPGGLLHEGFFAHAASTPDATALLWDTDGQMSYAELSERALRVAGALTDRGVRPGDTVSVHLPKGPDQITAVLGVLAAGACYVPIGIEQPAARRAQIEKAGDVVLTLCGDDAAVGVGGALGIGEAARFDTPAAGPVTVGPDEVAYVIFTSGSTGTPKGVEMCHRAALNTIEDINERFGITAEDRVLAVSALDFDLSVWDIFGLLGAGGALVLVAESDRRDAQQWLNLCRRHRVTVWDTVPALMEMLLTTTGGDPLPDSLRLVFLSGDWIGLDLPGALHDASGGRCALVGMGGATEAGIWSNFHEVTKVPAHWRSVPYGTPLSNQRFRVVDARGRDCPDWVPGELWIGGGSVADGYRNDPERTADRFVMHEGDRWYRTGDMGRYWSDGTLEFLGRRDNQVKLRGYRIELGEVEAALRAVPAVHHAMAEVVGRTSQKLIAAVTLTGPADEAAVLRAVADMLPPHMIPERLEILREFPLTANGKLDRKAVRAVLRAGAPPEGAHVEPVGELEAALAEIVAKVLGAGPISVEDDFFAVGGDSVLATKAVAQIREWLDTTEPKVADLFAARTVRALAERLASKQSAPGRIEQAAKIYREVAAMTDEELLAASRSEDR
ncbi:amino acid adenylation domain-containing protein [Streptomyces sp. NBC_00893]|uniref:non-ribosomal peptide synthetase n=1 Tax=Streptomyces sp. NBC_00893 TaxID=2975862 RepID=UPI00225C2128|nr:amino acid adenylation domain-containing protein [Streptomyces sp. NBC_00893]MCX4849516.1 amino acid adenylation domain-containing protein [Streptomyces sp. NBC_00893]